MTLKEKVAEVDPDEINEEIYSGVEGCPIYYEFLNTKDGTECPRDESGYIMTCIECWNREYKEATE